MPRVTSTSNLRDRGGSEGSREAATHVIVRFRDAVAVAFEDHAETSFEGDAAARWELLAGQFPGITLLRPYRRVTNEQLRGLVQSAATRNPEYRDPGFEKYFAVRVPPGTSPEALKESLQSLPDVAHVYLKSASIEPATDWSGQPDLSAKQTYLDPSPDGVDARFAWDYAAGAGVRFASVEYGAWLEHPDLQRPPAGTEVGDQPAVLPVSMTVVQLAELDSADHGTQVLGAVRAQSNAFWCTGVAPECSGYAIPVRELPRGVSETICADALLLGCLTLGAGDVLVIELDINLSGFVHAPVEADPLTFHAIRLVTALGITVIEAAGNGYVFGPPSAPGNLDAFIGIGEFAGRKVMDRTSSDFHDSGAIVVASARRSETSVAGGVTTLSYEPNNPTNLGSRVDCFALGSGVWSLAMPDDLTSTNPADYWTEYFGDTSAASAIIAGTAVLVQSALVGRGLPPLSPLQMRAVLRAAANGTTPGSDAAGVPFKIGVMPDLRKILGGDALNLLPDVYVRDAIGDTGLPDRDVVCHSPDIIVVNAAVADPNAAFGELSGTANLDDLSEPIAAANDRWVYVRVRNRGGTDATFVRVRVFWSPPGLLVTPDEWNPIGEAIIPLVATGDALTVSPGIRWPQAQQPGPGHYCFVAVIGSVNDPATSVGTPPPNESQDPAPLIELLGPEGFRDYELYVAFVRNNNNVAWKNFHVLETSASTNVLMYAFSVSGPFDRARVGHIEIECSLPDECRAWIELPDSVLGDRPRRIDNAPPRERAEAEAGAASRRTRPAHPRARRDWRSVPSSPARDIAFNLRGTTRLPQGLLPMDARGQATLHITTPRSPFGITGMVRVRQFIEDTPMGATTLHLRPARR